MVNTDPVGDMLDTFLDVIFDAGALIVGYFSDAIGGFIGDFIGGDISANTPALLSLFLVIIGTGAALAYKLSRG